MTQRGRRRATTIRVQARTQLGQQLRRFGIGLKEARESLEARQAEVAAKAGIGQSFESMLERGVASQVTVETLAAVALAVNRRLAVFIEAVPGADHPRDMQHLRRQALVIEYAEPGGWRATAERLIDPAAPRSRSIDVLLERPERREVAVVEIVDLIADGGATIRGLSNKVAAVRREFALQEAAGGGKSTVSGLLVVRGTTRNRQLLRELRALFRSAYPASSHAWLGALGDPERPMPLENGLVWSDIAGTRLMAAHLG